MKKYQKPTVLSNLETIGFFPALAAIEAVAFVGAGLGLAKRVSLEKEQYPHLEAVMCA